MTPVGRILVSLLDGARFELSLPELLCLRIVTDLPVTGAAMTLADESGVIRPLAASDERVASLQWCQFELGEGPGVDALRSGRLRQAPDLVASGREAWPEFARAALASGVRSVVSFPLRVGGIRLGVLDLFRDEVGRLAEDDLADALHHVDAAVLVLLHLQEIWEAGLEASWIDDVADLALHGHPEVHQATGMICVQADVPLSSALLLLRAHAFAAGRPVADVAEDVVARRLRFEPDETVTDGEQG